MDQKGMIVEAKTKLADRNVVWKEAYTPRSLFLKKQFYDIIGPGSYFRFEGRDTDSGDEYYIVVGPAKIHSPKEQFFAGVRKMPADYAAGGLYFHDMKEAMEYATNTWGVTTPRDMRYYDTSDIKGIGKKVKAWKEENSEIEHDDNYLEEWYRSIKSGEGEEMPTKAQETDHVAGTSQVGYLYVASDTYPFFTKVGFAERHNVGVGYSWWDIDDLFGGSASFSAALASEPHLDEARDMALKQREIKKGQIARTYGPEYQDSDFYKVWLVHRADKGTWLCAVGPYVGANDKAIDKFGVFTWKLNVATDDQIQDKLESLIQEYAATYGVALTQSDFNIPPPGKMGGEITIKKDARDKVYGSPTWKTQVLDYYGVQPGRGDVSQLREKRRAIRVQQAEELRRHYAISKENGDAFKSQQIEPPDINLAKRPIGQMHYTAVYDETMTPAEENALAETQKMQKFGFDSIEEAVEYLNTQKWPGAPVGDVPNVTSDDLRRAREEFEGKLARGEAVRPAKKRTPSVARPAVTPPVAAPAKVEPAAKAPQEKTPAIEESPAEMAGNDHVVWEPSEGNEVIGSALVKMIKMAEELDTKGMHKEAEEIQAILRKHIPVEKK